MARGLKVAGPTSGPCCAGVIARPCVSHIDWPNCLMREDECTEINGKKKREEGVVWGVGNWKAMATEKNRVGVVTTQARLEEEAGIAWVS